MMSFPSSTQRGKRLREMSPVGDGEINSVSNALGELAAEVRNLVRSQEALWRRFDEHAKADAEQAGVIKLCVDKISNLDADVKSVAVKVQEHETLKNKAVGYSFATATGISSIGAWLASFIDRGQ